MFVIYNILKCTRKYTIDIQGTFGNAVQPAFLKNLNFLFLLKFNMVCTF